MKIAVFLPNWIGDAVMATPAVRALHATYPAARMIWVGKSYIAGVVEGSPWFQDRILLDSRGPWSQRWPAAAWQLRRWKIDLAVLFPNSFRSAWVAWLGHCGRRVGFSRYGRDGLLTDRLSPVRDGQGKLIPSPIINDYNRLAQAAGCNWPGFRMELFTTIEDERAAQVLMDQWRLPADQEFLCLNPGAAYGAAKHWSVESFARLAQDLVDQRGCRLVVLCGPGERDLARQIQRLTARPGVHSLAEETLTLGLTKALVRRSAGLVTTDSGPRHFASAFQKPVVTLFGPTHIAWTETYQARAIHLQKPVSCGPCQLRVCPLDHRCMKELKPVEVAAAVHELLAQPPLARPVRKAS